MDILTYISNKLLKRYDIPVMADIFNSIETKPENSPIDDFIDKTSVSLKAQLSNFNIDAKIVHVSIGPVILRYELELAAGVSIKKFSKISDDLAITFKTHSIRIVAPIPGTSLVGIEIPNPYATIIPISSILRTNEFSNSGMILPVALAKTTEGNPFVIDITKAPHLLIAGCTGAGKSVCTNTIISSLLMTKSPSELKLVLIDPKIVEMQPYNKIPHLLRPIVTDPREAIDTFEYLVEEIESRYKKLASAGVRNIESYNKTVSERLAIRSRNLL
jgi:S-DNA-T family DNA segregation ATPase FtsK/SpoIIIE